ncbi:MAG TPA: hypothetical protein VJ746_04315, partial [Nitrospira sp.]|nr:hypothetical protein [Nitrospira sp.]
AALQITAGAASAEARVTPHEHESSAVTPHHSTSQKLPPSGLSPEEDLAYSRFMHHSSGAAVLIIGMLLLGDRMTGHRYRVLRFGSGLTWFALGLFLFIYSDLEAWPIGPAGFLESFSIPTADEWIQHHLLSMIPMVLGIYTILYRRKESRPLWSYVVAGLATLGGVALLIHQHFDHPDLDFVNIQHRFFAATTFFIAASLVAERSGRFTWNGKAYLLPAGLLLLGFQLAVYVE